MSTAPRRDAHFQEIVFSTLAGFSDHFPFKNGPFFGSQKQGPPAWFGLVWPSGLASLGLSWLLFGLPLASPWPPLAAPWPPFWTPSPHLGLSPPWPPLQFTFGRPKPSLGLPLASLRLPLASLACSWPPLGVPLASLGVLLTPLWPFFGFPWPPKGKGKGIAKRGKANQCKEMRDKTRQGKTKGRKIHMPT